MLLFYAEDAKLYAPVERLDLVQRYSSAEGHEPTLDRLGGLGWQKTKAKAKRAMRDMADELLKLYAERKLVTGYAFSGDSPWQREFEDAFEYVPTPDQDTAIEDVKRDMEGHDADGQAALRRRRLRQDRGRHARRLQGRDGRRSRWPCSRRRPCSPTSTSRPSARASPPSP